MPNAPNPASTLPRRFGLALALALGLCAAACGAPERPDGGEGMLPVGATAPNVSGLDQHGRSRQLAAERGHVVVVYFYPKDATPGCTKEACAFRDTWDRFTKQDVRVIGVSGDDVASHEAFAREEKLPSELVLIADPEHDWSRAFGVGTFLGMASRVSFLLDRDGKVAKIYPDVDPAVHARQVLADAAQLE